MEKKKTIIETHSLIIRCSERRLNGEGFMKWVNAHIGIFTKVYLLYIFGSTHDFIHENKTVRNYWKRKLRSFIKAKQITNIIICHHDDCFVYGDEDKTTQIEDMFRVKRVIENNNPGVTVNLIFGNPVDAEKEIFDFELVA